LKNQTFVRNMAKRIGEVQELQITLPNGFIGQFIRVRVKLDVDQKLTRFVSFTKAGKTEFFQVKYEKLPLFCRACGKMGHWHQECGTGEYDEDKLEWGPFILVPRRGRGIGRDFGQQSDENRGNAFHPTGRGRGGFGRGDGGRGNFEQSWRWNASENLPNPNVSESAPSVKRRLAMDLATLEASVDPPGASKKLALVQNGNGLPKEEIEIRDDRLATPQKNMNKKKLKAQNGEAIDTRETDTVEEDERMVDSAHTNQEMDIGNELQTTEGGAFSSSSGSAGSKEGSVRAQ
jgi:hypothetical protein